MAGFTISSDLKPSVAGLPGQCLRDSHPPDLLAGWLLDAGQRSQHVVEGLDTCPHRPGLNPARWEVGHLAWFTERWVLRRDGAPALRDDADALYDSSAVPQATRTVLPLPSWPETLAYLHAVREQVLTRLEQPLGVEDVYFLLLSIFHEDMHAEAFAINRQVLGYPAPSFLVPGQGGAHRAGPHPGDVAIPGGRYLLGALPGEAFVFDNEKWAHPVDVRPYSISRAPVTQSSFADFVDAGGYSRSEFWSAEGWTWLGGQDVRQPIYWRREGGSWQRRDFSCWVDLEPDRPMLHVSCFEAEAYCRWAKRRLPTEIEWEVAAAGCLMPHRPLRSFGKRPFPWGDDAVTPDRANLDGSQPGCVDVADCPDGDSAWGCRQMIGNVWEWTACDFRPYPGFAVDPYRDYSQPWFGTHRVLRGGCWLTRARLLRNTYRNFYLPGRRDIWAGFRTCALP